MKLLEEAILMHLWPQFARAWRIAAVLLTWAWCAPHPVRAENLAEFTYRSPHDIRFVVGPEGLRTISQGEHILARGGWRTTNAGWLFNAGTAAVKAGDLHEQSLEVISKDRVRLRHVQQDLLTTFDWSFVRDDMRIRARVENNHPTESLAVIGFEGPTFTFSRPPEGMLLSWPDSYVQNLGVAICWPSHFARIGGSYAHDDRFGVGLTPLRLGLSRCFFHWSPADPASSVRKVSYFVPAPIPPGGARTFEFAMRVSNNCDSKHLMQPYKEHFQANFGPMQYKSDHRLMGYTVASDPTWRSPENPLGFHPGGFRRFDRPEGAQAFCDVVVKGLKTADGQGLIGWALQGYEPRGALYRADFDIFPPAVEKNFPLLRQEFSKSGLRLGVCARPGEIVYRHDWKQDATVRINADDKQHLEMIQRRFSNLIDRGFTAFYLDTFGNTLDDVKAMRYYREKLGSSIPTYAEHNCDALLPYTGLYTYYRYEAKERKHTVGIGEELWDFYRWLMPEAGVIVQMQNTAPADARESTYRFLYRHHLTPLEHDSSIGEHASEARALQQEFLDQNGHWRN